MSARYETFKLARNYKDHREIYNYRKAEGERPDTLYSARIQGSLKYKDQREERVQKFQEKRVELEEEQIRLQKRREEEIKERAERKKDREQRQLEEFYSRNTVDWKSTIEDRRRRREDDNKESVRRGKAADTQWKGKLLQLEHKTEKYNQRREKRSDDFYHARAPMARSVKVPDSYTPSSSHSSIRIPSASSSSSLKSYEPRSVPRSYDVPSGDYSSSSRKVERTQYDSTPSSYVPREERPPIREKKSDSDHEEKEREDYKIEIEQKSEPLEYDHSQDNKENYAPPKSKISEEHSDDDEQQHHHHKKEESSHSSPEKSPREVHHKPEPEEKPHEPETEPEPEPDGPSMEEIEKELLAEQAAAAATQTSEVPATGSPPSSNDELDIKSFEFVDDPTIEADNPPQN